MSRAILAACALVLGACLEENSQCAAACANRLDVEIDQAAWTDGQHTLVARYDAHRSSYEETCTFTLPGGEDAACDDDRPDALGVELSVGAIVTLSIPEGPTHIALELREPGGETKSVELTPSYHESELCGQTCRSGSITTQLD